MMGSRGEIVEVAIAPTRVIEDAIYVAVGRDEKDSKSTLKWALSNSGGRKICIIQVHQPADKIPIMGTKFRVSQLEEQEVSRYREIERENMRQLLERYCPICQQVGVRAAKQHIEMDSIEKGIIELIIQHDITKLVMGAAADKLYSKKMMEPKSKKAIYVRQQALDSCHIWFVCKGNLIYTREGILDGLNVEVAPLSLQPITNIEIGQTNALKSRSVVVGQSIRQRVISGAHDYRRVMSDNHGMRMSTFSSPDDSGGSTPHSRLNAGGGVSDEWNAISWRSPSTGSRFSTCSLSGVAEDSALLPFAVTEGSEIGLDNKAIPHFKEDLHHSSPSNIVERNDKLYDQLLQAMGEVDNSRRDAFEESIRRRKAEVDAIDAIRRANASEGLYTKELSQRIEIEEELARGREEHGNIKQQLDEVMEELGVNVLSKLRHPHLVTLIGACPEAWVLIYEYIAYGSLEDRLNCKDNTPPLPWVTRIRIAVELCSVLIFIHSCSIVHGDLKPASLLLDANFVIKLSAFGLCRVLSENEVSSNNTTSCFQTDPNGTLAYMDPEFLDMGELTPKSDVYSFGIILLRLLTGMPAMKIAKEVRSALDKGNLTSILDPSAGDWSFMLAKQLAHLALRCCEKECRNRPDLALEAWKILESMKLSCGASPLIKLNSDEEGHIPDHFICPISQEIMQDPVIAADGFTYEAEVLRGWLGSGHDTSPMTNLKLGNKDLVPNRALRSAIKEWLQKPLCS